MADPGCVLSMDKLVAAAAHQLRGRQVHVVADSKGRGDREGGRRPRGGKKAGWVLEFPRVATLTQECSEPQFPPLHNGCNRVSPPVVLCTGAEGTPGCGYYLTSSLFPFPHCVVQEKEWMRDEGPERPERWGQGGAKLCTGRPHGSAGTSVRSPLPRRPRPVLVPSLTSPPLLFCPPPLPSAPQSLSMHAQLSCAPPSSRLSVTPTTCSHKPGW